ncbi:MAG: galactose oxidase [Henriciella sp.]|jgi:N-acetylneuraminic acid mutarotase|uniref:Kelch repeat-containing protein n=1 Tax=Henriciella sp. TaxID=1968823 RepID=UPI000C0D6F8F|nr:kelch repeat-containing protein [Henriciella sp.]MAN73634.1 galactose oxidase [Henriciella sp.]MBF34356.1 galactose oxidase [Hyphomonadaceae bacterium]MBK74015.1 galactose oxidase [Henriciella sp.]PHR75260.1 MAG: galactose oxidase [Henriciella sp.]|tara:strand:- start:26030 stop:27052 length:1023 start_codon:yes stop_codon:yes gene_type:complete
MRFSQTRRQSLQLIGAGLIAGCAAHPARRQNADASGSYRSGPALPFPVQEIYPCEHAGRIHLAGGFIAEDGAITGPTDAHHALDPESGIWQPRGALPTPRHHPQLVSLAGSLYCIGGFEAGPEGGWQMQSTAWRYDEAADTWTDAPALPGPNGESTAGVIGQTLYLAGGRQPAASRNLDWNDHADTAALLAFDGSHWDRLAPMAYPRNSAAGGVIDGRLHVVAGRTVEDGNTPVHEAYDPATDRWETLAPMPKGQGGLASGVVDGKLYTFGGEWFEDGGGVYPDAWVYDPDRDSWASLADMPKPRHGLGGVALGGDIYLIGGAAQRGGNQTSAAVQIYTP